MGTAAFGGLALIAAAATLVAIRWHVDAAVVALERFIEGIP